MVPTLRTTANILIATMASSSSSSLKTGQRRRAATNLERQSIRKRQQEHPAGQNELIQWFKQETGHDLNQSIISKILSSK
jgi:hypothetical protein